MIKDILIELIASELFDSKNTPSLPPTLTDSQWHEMLQVSLPQGVAGIALDAINKLPSKFRPSPSIYVAWCAIVEEIEEEYINNEKLVNQLNIFFKNHDIHYLLLKGAGLASYYPTPSHRTLCDIDIFTDNQSKYVDTLFKKELGAKIKYHGHYHTTCHINKVLVENHFDFLQVYSHKSNKKLNLLLKELAKKGPYYIDIHGEMIPTPNQNLNAIYIIRHMSSHFAAAEIGLKNIIDWGLFLTHEAQNINFDYLYSILKEYNLLNFTNAINTILVTKFGMDSAIIAQYKEDTKLADIILKEIMYPSLPTYRPTEQKNPIKSIVFRTKRFFANRWKHNIVYPESFLNTFFLLSWTHLTKPKSLLK